MADLDNRIENGPSPDEAGPSEERVHLNAGDDLDISPPRGDPFPIVGIGGSAGALEGFTQLLQHVPEDTGMAFVFIQHLDPTHASQLSEILSRATTMPVHTVSDGMSVEPNHVYVMPPNVTMSLERGALRLSNRPPGLHLPIDSFFESLARAQGGRAIAVVLSGNAADGSHGVRAVKSECGLTFAQDESTARFTGMPRNAIATGAVNYVLSPAEIGKELAHIGAHPYVRPPRRRRADQEILPEANGDLKRILAFLNRSTKVDFSHYKQNTVRRRIGRRMIVTRAENLAGYAHFLQNDPKEAGELYRDLLISVTNFFRDPPVYDALRNHLRETLRGRDPGQTFRVWVPGCATGEEVYSIAILISELLEELELNTPIQLFGTDISEIALDRARAATYPAAIAENVSEERLLRFFVRTDSEFQIAKRTRELCVFARQDLTNDPPFGNMDLVSCRNVLIYMDSWLHRRILPVLHYSLAPTGLLVLGTAESVSADNDLFTIVDQQNRIYGRKPVPARLTLNLALGRSKSPSDQQAAPITLTGADLQKRADRLIQSKYTPAAVVVNSDLQILHFRGRTGFYLDLPAGEANLSLSRMVREGLAAPLRRVIQQAAERNASVRESGIPVENDGERRHTAVEVTPLPGASPKERYYLVVFEEEKTAAAPALPSTPPPQTEPDTAGNLAALEAQIRDQQRQIADLREHIRNLNEDHEADAEELKASNEEVRSANEELQSTNEELSTTKEEVQSANEELNTLNEELQNRNQELKSLNSDLANILTAVDVPFLIVDNGFRLRRFSTAAEKLFRIGNIDIGYPLHRLEGRIHLSELDATLRAVVENLIVEQREIQDSVAHWWSITIRPYRTVDNRIDGALIVFADIDALKRSLTAAEKSRDRAEAMIQTVREPLLVLDADFRVLRATAAFYETFQVTRAETENRALYDLGNGQWNHPRLRELLGDALFRDQPFHDFEIEHDFPHIGPKTVRLNARQIPLTDAQPRTLLLAIEDVTKRQEEAEVRYRRIFESASDGILIFDAVDGTLTDVNPAFLTLGQYGRQELIGRRVPEMQAFHSAESVFDIVAETRVQGGAHYFDIGLSTASGAVIETELVATRYLLGSRPVIQVTVRDVAKRNQALRSLRDSEQRFRLFVESVRDYALYQTDANGRITSWNPGAERLLGYTQPEIVGQSSARLFVPEDVLHGEPQRELEQARDQGRAEAERWHVRKDGSRFFASGILTSIHDESGRLRGFAKIMRDVTARKNAEDQLRQQAQLLELAQDLILARTLEGTIVFWNRAAADAYGWSAAEALGHSSHSLLKTVFPQPLKEIQTKLLKDGHWDGELVHTRRNKSKLTVWSRWTLQMNDDGKPVRVLEVNTDITERQRADQQLRDSLQQKEILLKEMHHRVKNNLQMIASLLGLQSEFVKDTQALTVMHEMHTRVHSIAAIHEILYEAGDLARIDFGSYLHRMTEDLVKFYSNRANSVRLQIESGQISLDVTQAVPCGLITNELVTNCLKHAFPDQRTGIIEISFNCRNRRCLLTVADNGIGLPPDVDPRDARSMGMQLIKLLVEQLRGELRIDRENGTRFTLSFPQKSM